jgi:rod shape-determining protein MreC
VLAAAAERRSPDLAVDHGRMPLYTPGRRRAIVLLLLTSILLLTLDLRGNSIFDGARTGFNKFMDPLQSAADVATRPIRNAWHGIVDYQDVKDENERLQEQLDAQRGDQIAAQAAIQDQQALLALNDLPALGNYKRVTAMVVGASPSNLDQVVEINKGRDAGLRVGMAVTTGAGLIGKITTPLLSDRAYVMLLTDPRYRLAVKVVPGSPPATTTTTPAPPSSVPGESVPPTNAPPPPSAPPSSVPGSAPVETTTTLPPTTTTTTTFVPNPDQERDTGQLAGQGSSDLPQVDLLSDAPLLGRIAVGDLIFTAGGDESLAPPDIPIGTVENVIRRSSSEGPLLEIQPSADLNRLHFVSIVIYLPASEAGSAATTEAGG